MDKITDIMQVRRFMFLMAIIGLVSINIARAEVAPMPVVSGNQLNWPEVPANSINVHMGDGTYLTTLPGNATSWTAPAPGAYYLVATNDGDWPTWPQSETVVVEESPVDGPDLILTDLSVTSVDPLGSINIRYAYTVQNIGNANALLDNVSVQAFLSQDEIFNNAGDLPAGGRVITTQSGSMLAPGAEISGTFQSTTRQNPENFAFLTMKVDWNEVLTETDEANNTIAARIGDPLSAPVPTITDSQVNWPAVAANSINVHMGDGTYLLTLPGNATSWTPPAPGDYYLVATTDRDWSDWPRSDTFRVGGNPTSGPDLILTNLSVTGVDPLGSINIRYAYTVQNIGSTDALLDDVGVQAFLSQDEMFNNLGDIAAGGRVLTTQSGRMLAPGAEISGSFQATTQQNPENFTFLTMKVDWNEVLPETNEVNNTIATPIADPTLPPVPVVIGNQLDWPAVVANSINVHMGDGTYLETLPGNATTWIAPAPGAYYLVATNDGHWSTWGQSETVVVE